MRSLGSVVAALTLLLLASCASESSPPAAGSVADSPSAEVRQTPEQQPEWNGPDFSVEAFDGETFQLAAQAGRPVVLNFFESW